MPAPLLHLRLEVGRLRKIVAWRWRRELLLGTSGGGKEAPPFFGVFGIILSEPQSKPGIKTVYPEPCEELRRRPKLFMAGIVPY